ncbi:phage protease [Thiothrix lacustris]|uniref:phage protease n=1 Tax=Thiothrix lacustris TaxID=525917 RepID=UPI000688690A|nr:phage protease [Thiothrix lacustris]
MKQQSPHNTPSTSVTRCEGVYLAALRLDDNGEPLPMVQLLPLGRFRARDGRPNTDHPNLTDWLFDGDINARVVNRFAADNMPLLIDYEHQTMLAEDNGKPAPAAGWGSNMQVLADGLYVEVQWTESAKAMIKAQEYRFISPVFTYDEISGQVLKVLHAALTNYPALTGLRPVTARHTTPTQETDMPLKPETLTLLGVEAGASADDIHAAIATLKAKPAVTTPDPAQYVPLTQFEALKGELATLKAHQQQTEVDDLIEVGKSSGKLLAAQEQWARELGNSNVAALRSYLDSTPAIAALKGNQTNGKPPADGGASVAALTSDELLVAKQLGISPADFAKSKEAN